MRDYFCLDNKDIENLLFDTSELNRVFRNGIDRYESDFNIKQSKIGTCKLSTERKGKVYLSHYQSMFNKDIMAKQNEGIENIGLFFRKSGKPSYCFIDNGKVKKTFCANTNEIVFMHEDFNGQELIQKYSFQHSTSIHLPTEYFEHFVNLYPDLFGSAFLRYQKGESFYLKDNLVNTSLEMYNIISQIEHSYLMGNCQISYIDAKVLELLCLQFHANNNIKVNTNTCENNSDYHKIREAHFILISDIHNPPSIRQLALKVGLNEKKLKYGFKEVFSNTIYGYLFKYKMTMAKQLLLDTNKNISEIALESGYSYPSHFCTAFKREFGVSPHKFRLR